MNDAVCIAEVVGDATNFDLPAGQWSVCHSFQVQACRSPAVLQGELALKSRHIQKDGQDELGLIQNPLPIHKLDRRHRGRERGSHEWQQGRTEKRIKQGKVARQTKEKQRDENETKIQTSAGYKFNINKLQYQSLQFVRKKDACTAKPSSKQRGERNRIRSRKNKVPFL